MVIAIVGPTNSAKSTIGDALSKTYELDHIKTDYFKAWGYELVKEKVMTYINDNYQEKGFILSGMQAPRVLRQWARDGETKADLLVKVECSDKTIEHFYREEGKEDKIPSIPKQRKAAEKVVNDYLNLCKDKPEVITVNTSIL